MNLVPQSPGEGRTAEPAPRTDAEPPGPAPGAPHPVPAFLAFVIMRLIEARDAQLRN